MITKKDVEKFADLLEKAGLENAQEILDEIVIPATIESGLPLLEVIRHYADPAADQDTSSYQIHIALTQIDTISLNRLDIDQVITEKPS